MSLLGLDESLSTILLPFFTNSTHTRLWHSLNVNSLNNAVANAVDLSNLISLIWLKILDGTLHRPHCVNPANVTYRGRQVLDIEV